MKSALPGPPASEGSSIRLLLGSALFIAGLAVGVFGFVSLVRVLEGGGYGTPPMRQAFAILGGAGAALSAGIATLIWDLAKRYEGG